MTITRGRYQKELQTGTRDRISKLPSNILDLILERIPIQDAIRSSALARNWRYNWTTISKLVFDESFFQFLKKKKLHKCDSIGFIIAKILILHRNPISVFYLFMSSAKWEVPDYWILFLAKKGVKELTFETGLLTRLPKVRRMLSQHMKSFLELTHLQIRRCHFKVPANFRGFPKLISLVLRNITFEAKSIASFISRCPLLESLTLYIGGGGKALRVGDESSTDLNINSQSLRHLDVSGRFGDIYINAKSLITASIYPCATMFVYPEKGPSKMIKELGNLLRLEELSLGCGAFKVLASGDVPLKLPRPLSCLKTIEFCTLDFLDPAQVSAALCIIRSSPAVQEIEIWSSSSIESILESIFLDPESNSLGDDTILCFLKVVKLRSIQGEEPELEMIKSLLACSPSLEKMFIEVKGKVESEEGTKISKELRHCVRLSPEAEIKYLDYSPNWDL